MKKLLSILLAAVLLFGVCAFVVSAEETTEISRYPSYVTVGFSDENDVGESRNMVRNPYYQKYYNELLDYSYQVYIKLWKKTDNRDYIASYAKTYITGEENYVTLIFSRNTDSSVSAREYNLNILKKYFEEKDILYVSDYVPAAIVCVEKADAQIVNSVTELEFIGNAFFTNGEYMLMPAVGIYTLGNVLQSDSMSDSSDVNAADARYLLRYASGLEEVGASKRFYFCADMNFDNQINSADARLALRTAAGLEPTYYLSYGYFQYWNDFMGCL